MLDEMCATMGGRAAEEVMFGRITTGALSDLEKVTKQARAMVTIYGLNEKLGNVTYYDSSGQNEYQFDKPYSEKTAQLIDEEISALIEGQYTRAKQILRDNQDKLTALAEELLKHEVIFKENLETIFGKRPWLTSEEKVQAALDQAKPETDSTEDMDNALTESVVEAPLAEEALEGDSASDMADSAVENSDEENLESPQGNA
jgi:cell division protease FtsH